MNNQKTSRSASSSHNDRSSTYTDPGLLGVHKFTAKRYGLNLPQELAESLDSASYETRVSQSILVRTALAEYLQRGDWRNLVNAG